MLTLFVIAATALIVIMAIVMAALVVASDADDHLERQARDELAARRHARHERRAECHQPDDQWKGGEWRS